MLKRFKSVSMILLAGALGFDIFQRDTKITRTIEDEFGPVYG